jgi:hypothetical protein
MQLQQLFEKVSQVFTATYAHAKFTYSFVLRKVGEDGANRPVYVGDCIVHDESDGRDNAMKVAVVMRPNGTLYAAHYAEKMTDAVAAAGLAISTQRKAYGIGHRNNSENWTTYRQDEITVDGYDASID